MIAATIINCNPFKGDSKAVSPYDIYPDARREPKRQTPEEQESLLRAFFSRFKKKN